jgi:hypothetical protein
MRSIALAMSVPVVVAMTACAAMDSGRAPRVRATGAASGSTASVPSPVGAGVYSLDMRLLQHSACSQSWQVYDAHGLFWLKLGDDGEATACRARHTSSVDPDGTRRMVEQQGFGGRFVRDGAFVDVRLALDDRVCPQTRGYTNLAPQPWHLRCANVTQGDARVSLPTTVLACTFVDPVYAEALGYVAHGVLAQDAMLLGPGFGIDVDERDEGLIGLGGVRIEPRRAPVEVSVERVMDGRHGEAQGP